MEPLTFLPEVDALALITPASLEETLEHPATPFHPTLSAEDLSILSGIPYSEDELTSRRRGSRSWGGKLKGLLWSFGASALATVSGATTDDHSSSSHSTAALEQWPSSDHLSAQNSGDDNDDDCWEDVEETDDSLAVGFPFSSSNNFTFGSAEPPEPLLWG
ncbi:hypothetical protein Ndes2437A_g03680 [Nannochloris sp. 'desiccata']